MCGIFAYNGNDNSIPLLVEGLRNLEYRGYDSAGILGITENKDIYLEKSVGKVSNLANKIEKQNINNNNKFIYKNGIAHTRWATHGKVTEENTHPHKSYNDRFFVVHNGIIENYMPIKERLEKKYPFYSETDTEVIVKLIEDEFDGNILSTITKITKQLVGAYSIAIIDKENPNILIGTKLGSPMIVGIGKKGVFLSSDINALNKVATEFTPLEDNEIIIVTNGEYSIIKDGVQIEKKLEQIDLSAEVADKGKFETFTEKEIYEVPSVIRNSLKGRIDFKNKIITNNTLDKLNSFDIENIEIIASGSSYFAGLVGTSWFKELSAIKAEVRISSELLYEKFIPNKKTLYIFLSQSGETADVREGVKMAKANGCLTFGIVNVVGSTIARMCDMGLYTHSGIEIGVASTKNIIGQLSVLLLMSLSMGIKRGLDITEAQLIIEKLGELDKKLEGLLEKHHSIQKIAEKYSKFSNFFYLGRNQVYGTACECSLKLKELSYLHAEAYPTGELKHGPLALINPNFPCIVINPKEIMRDKTISNIKEIKARNGTVLGIITAGDSVKDIYDDIIEIPKTHKTLTPFLPLIPLWIFAVEVAKKLNRDIDKPQNLAKSVTVE